MAAEAGSAANSQVKTTSSLVKGRPSCQETPCLSLQITQVLSLATAPVSTVGASAARTGTGFPSESKSASGS